jgi:hypothetical protein
LESEVVAHLSGAIGDERSELPASAFAPAIGGQNPSGGASVGTAR